MLFSTLIASATVASVVAGVLGLLPGVAFLQPDEQLVVRSLHDVTVRNGPGSFVYVPFINTASMRKGVRLDEQQWMILHDALTAEKKVVGGPQLYFLGPHETRGELQRKIVMRSTEYVRLLDRKSGRVRLVRGPATVVPTAHEEVQKGVQPATKLSELEYIIVTDTLSGQQRVTKGPMLFFPGEYESVSETRRAYELKKHQYVRLLNRATGALRVERGEAIVFPTAHESPAEEPAVQDAVNVDDETSVLVRSQQTGQQRLVTAAGLFFPDALEQVVEVRKLVRVAPHETAVVRDNKGAFTFHSGNATGLGKGTAFFLPPYHELVTFFWSSGTSPDDVKNHVVKNAKTVAYKVPVSKIDLRAQYAFFEYNVRTSDNVELQLEGTIFWQVVDVPRMVERTGDPKGDVWYHARSALIQAVSTVTLEEFMASFNTIVAKAAATDASFYAARGVRLHGLEVVRYECKDSKTAGVLQEIIQETTNRINRLQQQRSANEVERERLTSMISLEKQRTTLIETKSANEKLEASVSGEAEGSRLGRSSHAFLELLKDSMPDGAARLALLRFLREQETLVKQTEHLSGGTASLFLTPQDVNLKLQVPPSGAGVSAADA